MQNNEYVNTTNHPYTLKSQPHLHRSSSVTISSTTIALTPAETESTEVEDLVTANYKVLVTYPPKTYSVSIFEL